MKREKNMTNTSPANAETMDAFKGTDYRWRRRPRGLKLPITYYPGMLQYDIGFWAGRVGWSPSRLQRATESVIRKCHHAAVLESRAVHLRPEVYELGIGPLIVMYTVEPEAVVVRGYAPNLPRHDVEEEISGGYSGEVTWSEYGLQLIAAREIDDSSDESDEF